MPVCISLCVEGTTTYKRLRVIIEIQSLNIEITIDKLSTSRKSRTARLLYVTHRLKTAIEDQCHELLDRRI